MTDEGTPKDADRPSELVPNPALVRYIFGTEGAGPADEEEVVPGTDFP